MGRSYLIPSSRKMSDHSGIMNFQTLRRLKLNALGNGKRLVNHEVLTIFYISTSPAGSLLAVKLHSENRVILNGKYEILISLILQWQDNPRKTMRNQLSLIIGLCGLTTKHDALDMSKPSQ